MYSEDMVRIQIIDVTAINLRLLLLRQGDVVQWLRYRTHNQKAVGSILHCGDNISCTTNLDQRDTKIVDYLNQALLHLLGAYTLDVKF
jgi:hypothetical protein